MNMKMENKSRGQRIVFIVGIAAMALAAGGAAASIVANSIVGSLSFSQPTTVPAPARPALSVNATRVSESTRSSVSIYKKRSGIAALDKVLLPSDEVGAGIVLTSDGWLVTSAAVVSGSAQLTAVFADKTTALLDPTKVVIDEATGIAFVKVDAQRLTVASFGDDTALHASDPIFLSDAASVLTVSVLEPRQLPVATKADYVESSERLGRRIMIDKAGLPGAATVNVGGETVGVSLGDGTAVPASFVTQVLRDLFKDAKIVRPAVGVRFVSLDTLPNAKDAGLPTTGAFVTGGGKYPAVAKGSAAELAGLKEGDVITVVEHDRINDEETLSERLQDYVPGAKVELTVMRGGKQIKLNLMLK